MLTGMLERKARRTRVARELMERNGGHAVGVELRHQDAMASRWCVIVPDTAAVGFKLEFFDERGFSGHDAGYETPRAALEEAIGDGFSSADPGALARLSGTATWAAGMAAVERVQRENALRWAFCRGGMSRGEFDERLTALREEVAGR